MSKQVQSEIVSVAQQPLVCPECGRTAIIEDRYKGEISCANCGLVIRDLMIDSSPEWRAFTLEERQKKRRTGPPTRYISYDKMLSTTFEPYRDALGKRLPLKTRRRMFRLRRQNLRARLHDSSIRNLQKATNKIRQISERLNLPHTLEEVAANIYRKVLRKKLTRGRSIDSIATASLFAACRITRTPRNLREIIKVSGRDRKDVTRCYRLIIRSLGLRMPVDDPIKFVSKIRSMIGGSQRLENKAVQILHKAKQKGILTGKDPVGVASAAVYIASRLEGEKVSQKKIAQASGVTEVTIRNRYKDIVKKLDLQLKKKPKNNRRR